MISCYIPFILNYIINKFQSCFGSRGETAVCGYDIRKSSASGTLINKTGTTLKYFPLFFFMLDTCGCSELIRPTVPSSGNKHKLQADMFSFIFATFRNLNKQVFAFKVKAQLFGNSLYKCSVQETCLAA